jgi:[ribosomal protein S5]-alanine N-acetyltransferase
VDVAPIQTERLELISMSPPFMEALLDDRRSEAEDLLGIVLLEGRPDPHEERFLRHRIDQLQRKPEVQQWLARAIVLREPDPAMIGHAGFHGEPGINSPGHATALEVGYSIFPEHRRQGYATEAVTGLLAWARQEGIAHFVASVAPDNTPSLAIIHKLGFVRTGEHWDDEDGLEHVFELEA